MLPPIDLSRVVVTRHAAERWAERTGRDPEDLGPALRRAEPMGRQLRLAAHRWLANGPVRIDYRDTDRRRLVADRTTGAVFLVKREASGWWYCVTVTTLDLVQGGEACPAAS